MQNAEYRQKNGRKQTALAFAIVCVLLPAVTVFGMWLLGNKSYLLVSALVMLLSCVPFFIRFEIGNVSAGEMAVTAVLCALSVLGRVVFAAIPGFKPVTAMVIIAGIAFGPETGFVTGSTSALVSNVFFGQGPWTPFQMFAWGIIGFISGLAVRNRKKPSLVLLACDGIIGGAIFSLLMDVWTTFSFGGEFSVDAYFTYVLASGTFMLTYIVSNIIFLVILARPLLSKFTRLKIKYGIFEKYK